MYAPLYKLDFMETLLLWIHSKSELILHLFVGNLPSFAECKQLTQFICKENHFTGVLFSCISHNTNQLFDSVFCCRRTCSKPAWMCGRGIQAAAGSAKPEPGWWQGGGGKGHEWPGKEEKWHSRQPITQQHCCGIVACSVSEYPVAMRFIHLSLRKVAMRFIHWVWEK